MIGRPGMVPSRGQRRCDRECRAATATPSGSDRVNVSDPRVDDSSLIIAAGQIPLRCGGEQFRDRIGARPQLGAAGARAASAMPAPLIARAATGWQRPPLPVLHSCR